MIEICGFIGLVFLALATVPQFIKVLKDKHADGMSWSFLIMLQIGFGLMFVYSLNQKDFYYIINYGLQFVLFAVILLVKVVDKNRKKMEK